MREKGCQTGIPLVMPCRLGLRPALVRLTVAATMISVGAIFSMSGVVSPAASASASSRIAARPRVGDASCLLSDELCRNDRLRVNEIDRGAALDG